jgi:2-dehydro-3-deoxyphosphogluconate aldolase/(4S)-4-hydroxy-2-oxoglutarate aldolase
MTIRDIMTAAPVIPVLVLDGSLDPAELATTLVEAGLPVIEVTLRTEGALDALRAMARVPGAIVGAGTVLSTAMLDRALKAGSRFFVSPGLTEPLGKSAVECGVPFLPGVATAGDVMRGLDLGLTHFKFFPAQAAGGPSALESLSGPFGDARFCPTGGITAGTASAWLALPSVLCVGGSWIVRPGSTLDSIAATAREAAALRPAVEKAGSSA